MGEYKKNKGKTITVTDKNGKITNNVSLQGKTSGLPTPKGIVSVASGSNSKEDTVDYLALAEQAGIVNTLEAQPLAADYAEYQKPEKCSYCRSEMIKVGSFSVKCSTSDPENPCKDQVVLAREFFDMDSFKDEVSKRLRIPAYVEYSDDGYALIYAGHHDEEGYYPLAMGPGYIENEEGFDFEIGQYTDFYVGKDDPTGKDDPMGAPDNGPGLYKSLYDSEHLIQFITSEYKRLNPTL